MTSINVSQRTQMIVVDVASRSVSVINAGPIGPAGPTGEVSLAQMNTALDLKVAKAGDTMTGALTIPVTPTAVGHATSKQYVDTAISNAVTALLDGTPGALDTLNELAAALGDDANFAASVTTALAGKQPLDSDLTALAGLATTAWGRQVLTLADSAAALTHLGAGTAATKDVPASGNASTTQVVKGDDTRLQAAADLTSHIALKNAHGVTRELITFTAATPVHIPGNLLSHDQQRGLLAGWMGYGATLTHDPTGGADGGGSIIMTKSFTDSNDFFGSSEQIPSPVTALASYTPSARLFLTAAGPRNARIAVSWFGTGGYLNTSLGDVVALTPGKTSTLAFPATAPASATHGSIVVLGVNGASWVSGESLAVSVACLRTSPTIPSSIGVAPSAFAVTGGAGGVCIKLGSRGIVVTSSAADSYIDVQLGALTSGRHKIELIGTQRSGTISSNGLIVDASVYPAGWSTICRTVTPFIDAGRGARLSTTPVEATPSVVHYGWAISCTSPTNGAELVLSDIMIESYS